MTSASARGQLAVVATPIGNLEDITLRALRILGEVDAVLAEDTRRTRQLFARHGIATRLESFHAHTPVATLRRVVDRLVGGARLALVTDAGTPLVSDPGAALIAACVAAGVHVEAIPGPSAVTAALTVAGVACDTFRFMGFLPRAGGRRRDALEAVASGPGATVFFESPQRVRRTLAELGPRLGSSRTVAVCRELTKLHEEVVRGPVDEVLARLAEPVRGELTVVVAPPGPGGAEGELEPPTPDRAAVAARVAALRAEGLAPKAIARALARELGVPVREAYALVLNTPRP